MVCVSPLPSIVKKNEARIQAVPSCTGDIRVYAEVSGQQSHGIKLPPVHFILAQFMNYAPARHQGATKIFWFRFRGALMLFIFTYSQWSILGLGNNMGQEKK